MTDVKINPAGLRELYKSGGVRGELERRGGRVLAQAVATAPVDSGNYRASLRMVSEDHPSRAAVHVGASVDYAWVVEADHGTLARALDAAR